MDIQRIPLPGSGHAVELLDVCEEDCLCNDAGDVHYRALTDQETP